MQGFISKTVLLWHKLLVASLSRSILQSVPSSKVPAHYVFGLLYNNKDVVAYTTL